MLINDLSLEFPEHKFIGEESVSNGDHCNLTNDPTWIIDPIDGTMNFVHGFPHSCISIALFINAEPIIGVIYNPMLEQLFTARKGKGAYYNGKKIEVSGETYLSKCLLMLETGTNRDKDRLKALYENLQTLIPVVHGLVFEYITNTTYNLFCYYNFPLYTIYSFCRVRSLGSAALNMAMVALGVADAYVEYGIHIWDIAAGEIIIKEAGGVVIDPNGTTLDRMFRRVLCASSSALAEQLAQKLIQFYPTPRD